jgi:putative ABC transport system permease protein
VMAQIALTQPLLVGLGVAMTMVLNESSGRPNAEAAAQTISIGFVPPWGNTIRSADPATLLRSDAYRAHAVKVDAALRRVATLPGVAGIIRSGGSQTLELSEAAAARSSTLRSASRVDVRVETPGAGFFEWLGLPIVRGRELVASDSASYEVPIVIGNDLASELWGNGDPLGKRLESTVAQGEVRRRYVVVGIYDAGRGLGTGMQPTIYAPMTSEHRISYLVHTVGPAAPVVSAMRSILHAEIPQVPVDHLWTLAERDEAERDEALRTSGALGAGGVLALLLASIGLYGVVALALGQRRREIGVRIALGAHPRQVVGMLFASGVRVSVAGLLLGLPLSLVAMRIMQAELALPQVDIGVVGVGIAMSVIGVASIATWLPARDAASVDPTRTLSAE